MPLTAYPDQGNPDFGRREIFIQPQTQRSRAPFRSPLDSLNLNLHYNSQQEDISFLYSVFDALKLDSEQKFENIYNAGTIEFPNDVFLKTIYEYGFDLKYLRQEIENLKQGLE